MRCLLTASAPPTYCLCVCLLPSNPHAGRYLLMKAFWFCYVAATALCIIASRKQ